ncbi:hypothetical protein [Salmonella enterica]|uniref:hypothetical protein n=1 Tax=Salmonella enterica TaxID=28901 RepID=UPI003F80F384
MTAADPRPVRRARESWTTARGPCACTTNRLSAGYGPGLLMALGGLLCSAPRYRRRKPLPEADETQRTVITAADFSADCRGAAVAAGAQRAGR